jgi:transposase
MGSCIRSLLGVKIYLRSLFLFLSRDHNTQVGTISDSLSRGYANEIRMPAPYSEDLRQKVIAAVEKGERKTDVSRMFNISRNTLDLWFPLDAPTGSCRSKVTVAKPKTKINDWERFREFIKKHGGKTQIEIAKLWGEGVTQQNISNAMKKMGVSRKKRVMDIEKEMNSNDKSFKKS